MLIWQMLLLLLHYITKLRPPHSTKIFYKIIKLNKLSPCCFFFVSIERYFYLFVRLCWGERFFVYGQNIFNMIRLN